MRTIDKSYTINQSVAAQDAFPVVDVENNKLLAIAKEMCPEIAEENLAQLVNKIPEHVKTMLENMPKIIIKKMLKEMGEEKISQMLHKQKS